MSELLEYALAAVLYLGVGFLLYRRVFPEGFLREAPDPEHERLRRTLRRRVLPLPDSLRDGRPRLP